MHLLPHALQDCIDSSKHTCCLQGNHIKGNWRSKERYGCFQKKKVIKLFVISIIVDLHFPYVVIVYRETIH